jgi:hypothetical protein
MNPQSMMQFMSALNTFRANHPKFAGFIGMFIKSGIPEGSVIEITVTKPGEEPLTTNMKVLQSDIELIQALKSMNPQG